jgi:hypothetical protein
MGTFGAKVFITDGSCSPAVDDHRIWDFKGLMVNEDKN